MGFENETSVSLSEVHRSVSIPVGPDILKRLFAFFGPAYLVSVGYMDPGKLATLFGGWVEVRLYAPLGPAGVQYRRDNPSNAGF